jgi:ribosome biogenesis GTPase A
LPSQSIKTNKTLIQNLKLGDGFVIVVIDALDISHSLLKDPDLIGKNPLILLNKVDLIPQAQQLILKNYIQQIYKNCKAVIPISAKTGLNLSVVLDFIKIARDDNRDVYFVGYTNVGKSKLTNLLIEKSGGKSVITTSDVAGTTVSMIQIPLSILKFKQTVVEKKQEFKLPKPILQSNNPDQTLCLNQKENYLYDTPGIFNIKQLPLNDLPKADTWYTFPPRLLKSRTVDMAVSTSYFIGGIIRIDIKSQSITTHIFTSNRLKIIHCLTINADEFYSSNLGKSLVPPLTPGSSYQIASRGLLKCYKGTGVYFSGVGWMVVLADVDIEVFSIPGVGVTLIHNDRRN